MRIGQALGLRHEDIQSWDNLITIVSRNDNTNGAKEKTKDTYNIHVSQELMDYIPTICSKNLMNATAIMFLLTCGME